MQLQPSKGFRIRPQPSSAAPTSPAATLFAALREGNEADLQELLPPLRERLTRLAKRRVREEYVEEVVQETLRTVWEKRGSIEEAAQLLPFVFRVLRNKIGNLYQRTRTERSALADEAGAPEPVDADPWIDPAAAFGAREFDRILTEATRKCARENHVWGRVLQLLREERSPREIQRELGDVKMATIHTRIFRARQRLREILRQDFGLNL